jgi:integrase
MGEHHYLEWHHGSWRAVVGYRVDGKVVKLRRSLGTGSLREAQKLRWAVVAELKASMKTVPTGWHASADAWKTALAASSGGPDDPTPILLHDHLDALRGDPIATEEDVDGNRVYLYSPERERQAVEFADRVYGRATPIGEHLEAFLRSRGELKEDTRERHERAVRDIVGWLRSNHLPPTIQAVTRKVAIRYIDQLPPGRRDSKRLSLYWQWLARRDEAQQDPWHGLLATPRARVEPERAWTDDEVRRLLSGPATPAMRDLMMVAALSGARLDAIIRMEVKAGRDGQGDTLILPPQKKETKARTIPLHSHLRAPLADFGGWPFPNSNAASAAFTRYRRKVLGADDGGRRRAPANFHSFRRWFISKAERAGIDERIISDVVGHARRSMTGRYSQGVSLEQMRVCVEAVRLPT